jgi:hypothetical protein
VRRALVAALLVGATPSVASAFLCTRVEDNQGVESGPSVSWFRRTLPFSLYAQGTNDMTGDQEHTVLRGSFAAWEQAQECRPTLRTTDLQWVEQPTSSSDRIGFDFLSPETNENLLIFRDVAWPHAGQEGQIIALTTTTFNALTGEIIDADIEFNSANFDFRNCSATACSTQTGSADTDLQNTAVHEIGHMLGLGHSTAASATMLARAQPGETEKRTLECDDMNAIVFKYPAASDNGYCVPNDTCGFCAPPGQLNAIPTVSVDDTDDGLGGCGCTGAGGGPLALVAAALSSSALRATRRRRRR